MIPRQLPLAVQRGRPRTTATHGCNGNGAGGLGPGPLPFPQFHVPSLIGTYYTMPYQMQCPVCTQAWDARAWGSKEAIKEARR